MTKIAWHFTCLQAFIIGSFNFQCLEVFQNIFCDCIKCKFSIAALKKEKLFLSNGLVGKFPWIFNEFFLFFLRKIFWNILKQMAVLLLKVNMINFFFKCFGVKGWKTIQKLRIIIKFKEKLRKKKSFINELF